MEILKEGKKKIKPKKKKNNLYFESKLKILNT